MESLSCPNCGNSIFKEVSVYMTECKKVAAGTRIQLNGKKESSGELSENCEAVSVKPSTERVSYICEGCGHEYVLQGHSMVPAWL